MADHAWHEFPSPSELADALSDAVAQQLQAAVEARGSATIAVSGGRTPALFFDRLSSHGIAWDRITVTLVDERFVPNDSPRSNARLVAQHLLQNEAARADFIGLYNSAENVEDAAEEASAALARLALPLDVVVLGMGADRHTASFFPDAANIEALLLPGEGPGVLPVHALSAGEPRLTLSMQRIAGARFLALHIEGDDKKDTLETALAATPGPASPIGAVLKAAENTAQIYWAPKH